MASFSSACSPCANTGTTILAPESARPMSSSVCGTRRRSCTAICPSTCWRLTPLFSAVATSKSASLRSSDRLPAPTTGSVLVTAHRPTLRHPSSAAPQYRNRRQGVHSTRRGQGWLGGAEAAARGGLGVLDPGLGEAALGAQLLGAALAGGGVLPAQLVLQHRVLGEDVDPGAVLTAVPGLADVQEAAVDHHRGALPAGFDVDRADVEGGERRGVSRQDAEVARDRADDHEVGGAGPHLTLGSDQVDVESHGLALPRELLGLLLGLLDPADVEERLLRQVVVLAARERVKGGDGLLQRHGLAGHAGELLGHEEGLGQEPLDLAGAVDQDLVVLGQLVDSQDRDDVLQVVVALEDLLHALGHAVVVLAHVARGEDARGRVERVYRRLDSERGYVTDEHGGRVQGGERRVRGRVGVG